MNLFKIAHLNTRSLLAGFPEFKDNLIQNNYDIFSISESWLNNQIDDETVRIPGYTLVRKDRGGDIRGGGVCMFINNNIKFEKIEVGENNDSFEQQWIKLTSGKRKFCFGVLYRPPSKNINDFFDSLEDTISHVLPICDDIVFMGDINIDLLDLENSNTNNFNTFLIDYEFKQLINEPTRISLNKSSLLDIIVCSSGVEISDSGVNNFNNLRTDHELIYCNIKKCKQKISHYIKTYRDFRNFDYNLFSTDLQMLPFNEIFYINSIEQKLILFNKLIIMLFNEHAPFKTVRCTKPKAAWLTENIRMMMDLRDQALTNYKQSKDLAHFNYYKNLKNFTNTAIKNEKKAYINNKIRTGKSKTLWKDLDNMNIYSSRKKNRNLPPNLSNVNEINNFFINSVKKLASGNVQGTEKFYTEHLKYNNNVKFSFSLVNNEDILEIIKSLTSNAVGYDGISLNMLKYCCPYVLPFITHIINSCLSENYFPNIWKISIVLPLPKVAHPEDYKDLRPISVLPPLSKILERIVSNQIKEYLDKYNILPLTQSGFRKNFSCTTALCHIIDDILLATENDELTVLTLIDYSKAFDCINHGILLAILHYIGFSNTAVFFIGNYLSNRKQIVKLNDNMSTEGDLDRGVPQGSILGPLLFLIYTSQLHTKLASCKIHQYADDTQLYKSFKLRDINTANQLINDDLNTLVKFSKDHNLCINPSKSAVMIFGNKQLRQVHSPNIKIQIEGTIVEIINETKNLGLTIDTDLRFKSHINNCVRKAYCNLKNIYSNKELLDKKTIKLLCEALVLSHFAYCDIIYGPCIDAQTSRRIQKVQNSCTRLICGIRRGEHISHMISAINWLNMSNRRFLHSSVFFHRLIKMKTPPYLYNKIKFRTDIHNINIRRKSLITPPAHKTAIYERSFTYTVAKIYNAIPAVMRKSGINKFKFDMKKQLLVNQ